MTAARPSPPGSSTVVQPARASTLWSPPPAISPRQFHSQRSQKSMLEPAAMPSISRMMPGNASRAARSRVSDIANAAGLRFSARKRPIRGTTSRKARAAARPRARPISKGPPSAFICSSFDRGVVCGCVTLGRISESTMKPKVAQATALDMSSAMRSSAFNMFSRLLA